jgi:3-oxoacyl-[acyl-carrier protein] reductase
MVLHMDLKLDNKVILVAGASTGLGFGVASAVAAEGAKVSMASRSGEDIVDAAGRLRSKGHQASAFVCDVTNASLIDQWVAATVSEYGAVDGLVLNGGGPPLGKFDDFDDEAWARGFELTLMSAVRMIRAVLPIMRDQGSGAIVAVTSMSVKEPIDHLLLSNVYRSGVTSLVKSLSRDLAGEGIRINNLVPGRMNTERTRSTDKVNAGKRGVSVEVHSTEQQAMIPIGRYGEADEYGAAAAFLLSDAASYITGSTLTVDGGKTATVW